MLNKSTNISYEFALRTEPTSFLPAEVLCVVQKDTGDGLTLRCDAGLCVERANKSNTQPSRTCEVGIYGIANSSRQASVAFICEPTMQGNAQTNYHSNGLNRLTSADNTNGSGMYSSSYTYDKNGNITSLKRNDNLLNDDLKFSYTGNQLTDSDNSSDEKAKDKLDDFFDTPFKKRLLRLQDCLCYCVSA